MQDPATGSSRLTIREEHPALIPVVDGCAKMRVTCGLRLPSPGMFRSNIQQVKGGNDVCHLVT